MRTGIIWILDHTEILTVEMAEYYKWHALPYGCSIIVWPENSASRRNEGAMAEAMQAVR